MHSVTIIGIGRVGRALASSLLVAGYHLDALVVRAEALATESFPELPPELLVPASFLSGIHSDIVFITTQDYEIQNAVESIREYIRPLTTVFHTSGSLSSAILEPLARVGVRTGSMHPLISISRDRTLPEPFHGAYFCVEGEPEAVDIANELVADLGGIPFTIDTSKKAMYHASAVMACGHLVALIDAALAMMEQCGPDAEFSRRLLMPLVSSTIANVSAQSTSEALTGPFARADAETIQRHLAVLGPGTDPELLEIYTALGRRSLDLALRQGADESRVNQIRKLLLWRNRVPGDKIAVSDD